MNCECHNTDFYMCHICACKFCGPADFCEKHPKYFDDFGVCSNCKNEGYDIVPGGMYSPLLTLNGEYVYDDNDIFNRKIYKFISIISLVIIPMIYSLFVVFFVPSIFAKIILLAPIMLINEENNTKILLLTSFAAICYFIF